jgi:sugar/nucleoside kinase (ribokinase family)
MRVVNTVGAGDVFLGVFAAMTVKGFGEIESLFMANVAAALKTTKEETRGSPRYDELMRYVKDRRVESLQTRIRVQ